MHHIDIQQLDNKQFYYVYDGNRLASNKKNLNIWGPLKWTFIDLKNWFFSK
jgi:hypothetical protein